MKLRNTEIIGIIILGIGAIAIITNPTEQKYQEYADIVLKNNFKSKVCTQVMQEKGVWLESQCHLLINIASPQLAGIVTKQSERQNFLFFSIYLADIPLPPPLPSYHLDTIGILGNFYTYQAKKI